MVIFPSFPSQRVRYNSKLHTWLHLLVSFRIFWPVPLFLDSTDPPVVFFCLRDPPSASSNKPNFVGVQPFPFSLFLLSL